LPDIYTPIDKTPIIETDDFVKRDLKNEERFICQSSL
jgi:hypothetical protein